MGEGEGEGGEEGVEGGRCVGEVGLVGGPIEEAQCEGVVAEEERVDDGGHERRRQVVAATQGVEGVLQ